MEVAAQEREMDWIERSSLRIMFKWHKLSNSLTSIPGTGDLKTEQQFGNHLYLVSDDIFFTFLATSDAPTAHVR